MSFLPRWKAQFPTPKRASELLGLGKFIENVLEDFNPGLSGLSISSDDKNVYVEAAVPGLSAKDIDVSVDNNNILWIKGSKKEEEEDKKRQFYRQSQTSFSYCVPLWDEIDASQEPEAECKDGVMKIIFNKHKDRQVEAKKIKVKGS